MEQFASFAFKKPSCLPLKEKKIIKICFLRQRIIQPAVSQWNISHSSRARFQPANLDFDPSARFDIVTLNRLRFIFPNSARFPRTQYFHYP